MDAQMVQCKAKSKRSGERCRKAAMKGREVCKAHGGDSLVGAAHPNFQHGRRTRLPVRLAADYEAAQIDPSLVSMHNQLALLEARRLELQDRLDREGTPELWDAMKGAVSTLRLILEVDEPDIDDAKRCVARMSGIIGRYGENERTWEALENLVQGQRKLADSERRRLVELNQIMTADRALALFGALIDIVARNVTDRTVLGRINREAAALLNVSGTVR